MPGRLLACLSTMGTELKNYQTTKENFYPLHACLLCVICCLYFHVALERSSTLFGPSAAAANGARLPPTLRGVGEKQLEAQSLERNQLGHLWQVGFKMFQAVWQMVSPGHRLGQASTWHERIVKCGCAVVKTAGWGLLIAVDVARSQSQSQWEMDNDGQIFTRFFRVSNVLCRLDLKPCPDMEPDRARLELEFYPVVEIRSCYLLPSSKLVILCDCLVMFFLMSQSPRLPWLKSFRRRPLQYLQFVLAHDDFPLKP